jgi:ribosomal protein L40E
MVAATVYVILPKPQTELHPAALLLVSAAIIGAGLVGLTIYKAVSAFLGDEPSRRPLDDRAREILEREKALVLRSIKELEFDRSMKKVSDADFADMSGRLRARALTLMQELERQPEIRPEAPAVAARREALGPYCDQCGTKNDRDAKFCKKCGHKIT